MDGSLYYASLELTCYQDGFVGTSDGWLISEDRYTFRFFIEEFEGAAEVFDKDSNKPTRSWPRPIQLPKLEKQTDNFYNSQFYKDWIFRVPKSWTILPGERVLTSEDRKEIFYPNGIKEDMSSYG